jgi:HNH endonuclease
MPWGRLDDQLHQNGKVLAFSDKAFRVWMYSISFCNAKRAKDPIGHLTEVEALAVVRLAKARPAVIREILDRVGWEQAADGRYVVHDFPKYGPPAHNNDPRAAYRMALSRDPELRNAIKARDAGRCRYCGRRVDFADRKGPQGATYDHLDPRGPNTLENVVVCCRACNSRKRGRTIAEAGMKLIRLPDLDRDPDPGQNGTNPVPMPVPVPVPVPDQQASTPAERSLQEETARAPDPTAESVRVFAVPKPGQRPEALEQRHELASWLLETFHGASAPNAAERERIDQAAGLFYESRVPVEELPRLVQTARERWSAEAEITPLAVARNVSALRARRPSTTRNGRPGREDEVEQAERIARRRLPKAAGGAA